MGGSKIGNSSRGADPCAALLTKTLEKDDGVETYKNP